MSRRQRRTAPSRAAAFATALAVALTTAAAGPAGALGASAAEPPVDPGVSVQEGTWYADLFGIPAIHESGVTGAGVTVAVLDTPINPDVPDLRGADVEPRTDEICSNGYDGVSDGPEAQHGTSMVSVIAGTDAGTDGLPGIPGVAPDAHVLHYAVLTDPSSTGCELTLEDAVTDAVDAGARIISMSLGWEDTEDLERAVLAAHEAGAIVDIAVQNEDGDELDSTSAANGVVAIENMTASGGSDGREVHDPRLTGVAPGVNIRGPAPGDGEWNEYHLGVGSSPATAWVSGVLALAAAKWPEATSNQLIQSLIRNTSNGWPELSRTDQEGFGLFSPQNLMVWDPTRYPDENPLLVEGGGAYPAWSDVMGDATPTDWGFTDAGVDFGTSLPTAEPTKVPPAWWTTFDGIRAIIGCVLIAAFAVWVVGYVRRLRARGELGGPPRDRAGAGPPAPVALVAPAAAPQPPIGMAFGAPTGPWTPSSHTDASGYGAEGTGAPATGVDPVASPPAIGMAFGGPTGPWTPSSHTDPSGSGAAAAGVAGVASATDAASAGRPIGLPTALPTASPSPAQTPGIGIAFGASDRPAAPHSRSETYGGGSAFANGASPWGTPAPGPGAQWGMSGSTRSEPAAPSASSGRAPAAARAWYDADEPDADDRPAPPLDTGGALHHG